MKVRFKAIYMVTLLIAMLLCSCSNEQYIVTVTIKNVDSETGLPINGATSSVGSGQKGHHSNGISAFTLDGECEYSFTSKAFGYNDLEFSLYVDKESFVYEALLDKKSKTIIGILKDDIHYETISNARVNIASKNFNDYTNTDEEGFFKLIVPSLNETYTITIELDGFCDESFDVDLNGSSDTLNLGVIYLCSQPGGIEGIVFGFEEMNLSGVKVNLWGSGAVVTTGWDGCFKFDNLKPGPYTIEFRHKDYKEYSFDTQVKKGENSKLQINLVPKPGWVEGMTNAEKIYIREIEKSYNVSHSYYIINDLEPGKYNLVFSKSNCYSVEKMVEIGPNQRVIMKDIILESIAGGIIGIVVDGVKNQPMTNATIILQSLNKKVVTDINGLFTFTELPVGIYDIKISAYDYKPYDITGISVKQNSVTDVGTIYLLKDPARVLGNVVCAENHSLPLQGVVVTLTNLDIEKVQETYTDEQGYFNFDHLYPGNYHINFKMINYEPLVETFAIKTGGMKTFGTLPMVPYKASVVGITTPGALVEIRNRNNKDTADSSGAFKISDLKYGSYHMDISHRGHVSAAIDICVNPGQMLDLGDCSLEPLNGSIVGKTNADKIFITELNKTIIPTTEFCITGLEPNEYTLLFEKIGYQSVSKFVRVGPGEKVDLEEVILGAMLGGLMGKVLDGLTLKPITDATIMILQSGQIISTDSGGVFILNNLPVGNHSIKILVYGYPTKILYDIEIEENKITDLAEIKLLKDTITVLGNVYCKAYPYLPLEEVDITLTNNSLGIIHNYLTDKDGRFLFHDLYPGKYNIVISYQNYEIFETNFEEFSGMTRNLGKIYLEPMKCRVLGKTTPRASVRVISGDNTYSDIVDGSGLFLVKGITYGNIVIKITLDDYDNKTIEKQIGPGDILDLGDCSLEPKPGGISGNTNAAKIKILELDKTYDIDCEYFYIDHLKPDNYNLNFSRIGYQDLNIRVEVKPNKITKVEDVFLKSDTGKLNGRVVDGRNGKSISGSTVVILELNEIVSTNSMGVFNYDCLPMGIYTVIIEATNYETKRIESIEINSKQPKELSDIKLFSDTSSVAGRICCSVNNAKTLRCVDVSLKDLNFGLVIKLTSNNDGYFSARQIYPGNYMLECKCEDYEILNKNIVLSSGENYDCGNIYMVPHKGNVEGTTSPESLIEIEGTSKMTTSSTTGQFIIKDVVYGKYMLKISKDNYYSKTISIEVEPGKSTSIGTCLLEPLPGAIEGRTNATTIHIKELDKKVSVKDNYKITNLIPDRYTLVFTRDNYKSIQKTVDIKPNGKIILDEINLTAANGNLIGNAKSMHNIVLVQTGQTVKNCLGKFEFKDLEPGNYFVKVEKASYFFELFQVTIKPGETFNLGNIDLKRKLPHNETPGLNKKTVEFNVSDKGKSEKEFTIPYAQEVKYLYRLSTPTFGIVRIFLYDSAGCVLLHHSIEGGQYELKGTLDLVPDTYKIVGELTSGWGGVYMIAEWFVETTTPKIVIDKTFGYGESSYNVIVSSTNEYSEIPFIEYCISSNLNVPLEFGNKTKNNSVILIKDKGCSYLHIKAVDSCGNEAYRVEGPYIID